ncbi:type I glyceraldehyde-3-phosphate dehydrogenase [Candidatus Woesearchaeota archaeon]|nr:type I glyceraldehyde-3-phosphate dehydrogenase [Candidatus Woesearchaeota archaeon]
MDNKPIRVGINGLGHIGMHVLRAVKTYEGIEIVAINNYPTPPEKKAYLLTHDSIYGKIDDEVRVEGEDIILGGRRINCYNKKHPSEIPWGDNRIDIAIDATGKFARDRTGLEAHLKSGARCVIVSTGTEIADRTIVYGVNNKLYSGEKIIASGSCTTNCLAPVAYVLQKKFGISRGIFTTTHAITGSQSVVDSFDGKDERKGRTAGSNIIPTTTGAEKSIGMVLPSLEGLLEGSADRVPVDVGSILHLTADLKREVSADDINLAMKEASKTYLNGILQYLEDDAFVSSDVIGNPIPSVFDALLTKVVGKKGMMITVSAWYDNIAGTANQILRLAQMIAKHPSYSSHR